LADHGLTSAQVAVLRQTLAAFGERIEAVGLFGSRATGRHRDNSDIDLVLYGPVTQRDLDRIWSDFDDSALSVPVDVVAYDLLETAALRRHIDTVMLPLFGKAELTTGQDFSAAEAKALSAE
jgi:uncharacterized protein